MSDMTNLICQLLSAFPFMRTERPGVIQENSTSNRRDKPNERLNERQAFDELILIKNNFTQKQRQIVLPERVGLQPSRRSGLESLSLFPSRDQVIALLLLITIMLITAINAKEKKQGGRGKIHVYLISKLTMGHLGNSLLQWTKNALVS